MKKLEPPDTFHLSAAQGWLGLGDPVSASDELEKITPQLRAHPDVLLVRCEIYHAARKWDALLDAAEILVRVLPNSTAGWVNRSYALHELKRTQEAFDQLLPATGKFPKNWLIPYNLACYCARMRKLKESRAFLRTASALGDAKKIKFMALEDKDLEALWQEIGRDQV
jgi:predicted Zn-dependent protease